MAGDPWTQTKNEQRKTKYGRRREGGARASLLAGSPVPFWLVPPSIRRVELNRSSLAPLHVGTLHTRTEFIIQLQTIFCPFHLI